MCTIRNEIHENIFNIGKQDSGQKASAYRPIELGSTQALLWALWLTFEERPSRFRIVTIAEVSRLLPNFNYTETFIDMCSDSFNTSAATLPSTPNNVVGLLGM